MWEMLKSLIGPEIPGNVSVADFVRWNQEQERYRKKIKDLEGEITSLRIWNAENEGTRRIIQDLERALEDAREEALLWKREAMRNIAR